MVMMAVLMWLMAMMEMLLLLIVTAITTATTTTGGGGRGWRWWPCQPSAGLVQYEFVRVSEPIDIDVGIKPLRPATCQCRHQRHVGNAGTASADTSASYNVMVYTAPDLMGRIVSGLDGADRFKTCAIVQPCYTTFLLRRLMVYMWYTYEELCKASGTHAW